MNIVLDDVCMTINEFQSFDLITDQIQELKVSGFLRKFLLSYLQLFPTSMSFRTSSVHLTTSYCSPTTCTCCFPSSSTLSLALRFSRSNTYKHSSVSIRYYTIKTHLLDALVRIFSDVSWGHQVFRVSQHHTPSPRRPSRG